MKYWIESKLAQLKELHAEGKSGGQIAHILGVTRNAVIGKIHRLGLNLTRKKEYPPHTQKAYKRKRVEDGERLIALNKPCEPLPPGKDNPAVMQELSILQLEPRSCRFPVGDVGKPGFFFCGNTTPDELLPYCDHHMKITHTTASQYRDYRMERKDPPYYGPKI